MPEWFLYFIVLLTAFLISQLFQYLQLWYATLHPKRIRRITDVTHGDLIKRLNTSIREGDLELHLPEEVLTMLVHAVAESVKKVWQGLIGKMQAQANGELEGAYVEYQDAAAGQMGQEQVGQIIMNKIMQGFMKKLEKM